MPRKINLISAFVFFFYLGNAQNLTPQIETLINQEMKKSKLSAIDIENYEITHNHISVKSQIHHFYLRQTVGEIPVNQAVAGVHISKDSKLISFDQSFVRNAASKINASTPLLSAAEAIVSVAQKENYPSAMNFEILENPFGITKKQIISKSDISLEDIPAQLVYQQMEDKSLRLAWDLSILELDADNWWSFRIDALTGEILDRNNWIISCNFDGCQSDEATTDHHDHSCHSHSKSVNLTNMNPDSYRVFALGIESPNHGSRTLEVDPADLVASPFGWHDTDGAAGAEFTITRGNNVHAQEDQNGNNGTGDSPDGGTTLDFDFPVDFNLDPLDQDNENSALTNLFYWNNIMHDVWYQYGFDEASGNFQSNNYGNGGADSDYVLADGQDGAGTNNANFGTPTDGSNPRMQMFLWDAASTSSFDVNSPSSIAGNYDMAVANFGPSSFNLTGDLVIVDDGSAAPTEGCNILINDADLNGNIALVDRGNCQFGVKCLNAQNAGAIAVLVCNNVGGAPFAMAPGTDRASVTIPSIMISQADCASIRVEIPTVNVTMDAVSGGVQIDSDFDNGIVAHEYGHGISTRLTGGAGNSGCLGNNEQMGEGWSDWFGLMLTTNSSNTGTEGRGIGTYALGQATTGVGIRDYPYSTDMAVNPFTYNDIDGVSVPHGVGSVWSTMLWEMTWLLVAEYGWDNDYYNGTGGNNIAMELVIEGLKLQPCNPGFVDGRDAILSADQALNAGVNQCLIWEAFAKRGLGVNASQGSSASVTDGVESYDTPGSCTVALTKIADVNNVAPGGIITYTLEATNNTSATVNNIVLTDDLPLNTTYVNASATNGGTESGGVVSFPAVNLGAGLTHTVSFSVMVDVTLIGGAYDISDDVELGNTLWESTATNAGLSQWIITNTNPNGGTSHWFAEDVDSPNDQYLSLLDGVIPLNNSELKFFHLYDTEQDWDGGRVEISTDDGLSWSDLGNEMTQNGYNGILDDNPATPGFTGDSGGYLETIIDLSAYANQAVKIRFFMHCDAAVGGNGWYVDDITISNLQVAIPNIATMSADGGINDTASLASPTIVDLASCNDGVMNGNETDVDCGGDTCFPCGDCFTEQYYSGTVADGIYQTSELISSDGIVLNATNVEFYSLLIEMDPGFTVEQGATYLAEIIPCVPVNNDDNNK